MTHIICWGVYLTGDQNDVTVPGPAVLAEIMLWGGKLVIVGREADDDLRVAATTVEVGQPRPGLLAARGLPRASRASAGGGARRSDAVETGGGPGHAGSRRAAVSA